MVRPALSVTRATAGLGSDEPFFSGATYRPIRERLSPTHGGTERQKGKDKETRAGPDRSPLRDGYERETPSLFNRLSFDSLIECRRRQCPLISYNGRRAGALSQIRHVAFKHVQPKGHQLSGLSGTHTHTCMCMCVCVCVCVCMHVCMYVCVCVYPDRVLCMQIFGGNESVGA